MFLANANGTKKVVPVQQLITKITLLIIMFWVLVYINNAFAKEYNLSRSELAQLTVHIETAEIEQQYEFAIIALNEMYNSYETELYQATLALPESIEKKTKVRRWRYATRSFLNKLSELFIALDAGASLYIYLNPQQKVVLLIGLQPVIINGPNHGANKIIETNIVNLFCQSFECNSYFTQDIHRQSRNSKKMSANLSGTWAFDSKKQASYEINNGLQFVFRNIHNRAIKEQVCWSLVNELNLLIQTLQQAYDAKHGIDWQVLQIQSLPVTEQANKVILDRHGGYIKLALPLLASQQSILTTLLPWLQAQFKNKPAPPVRITNVERLLD